MLKLTRNVNKGEQCFNDYMGQCINDSMVSRGHRLQDEDEETDFNQRVGTEGPNYKGIGSVGTYMNDVAEL